MDIKPGHKNNIFKCLNFVTKDHKINFKTNSNFITAKMLDFNWISIYNLKIQFFFLRLEKSGFRCKNKKELMSKILSVQATYGSIWEMLRTVSFELLKNGGTLHDKLQCLYKLSKDIIWDYAETTRILKNVAIHIFGLHLVR